MRSRWALPLDGTRWGRTVNLILTLPPFLPSAVCLLLYDS